MDAWKEALPVGSNVWLTARPMYDCVCVCCMNRSTSDVVVEVDFSNSQNILVMNRGGGGVGGGPLRTSSHAAETGAPASAATDMMMSKEEEAIANQNAADGTTEFSPSAAFTAAVRSRLFAEAHANASLIARCDVAAGKTTVAAVCAPAFIGGDIDFHHHHHGQATPAATASSSPFPVGTYIPTASNDDGGAAAAASFVFPRTENSTAQHIEFRGWVVFRSGEAGAEALRGADADASGALARAQAQSDALQRWRNQHKS